MNRRQFIKHSAVSSLLAAHPSIVYSANSISVSPTGQDDTDAINSALKASARIGDPVVLTSGLYHISDTIVVPAGASLIGNGRSTRIVFDGGKTGTVIQVHDPSRDDAVENLLVEDLRSPVPFIALIG